MERERISLGVKQMSGDPFNNFCSTHEKGSVVTGKVKSVEAKGAVIDLGNDTEAICAPAKSSGTVLKTLAMF